jgi:DNA-directed RNA polymerase subunit H (RpoH/RPB5)
MSSISSNRILNIYNSRNTILELLESQEFDVSGYSGFSINEIDAMFVNSQLDMLVSNSKNDKKVYVKYFISPKQTTKQIKSQYLDVIIEDLFVIDNVLTKKDTLIIIIDDEPNDTIITRLKYLFDNDGIFVVIHNIKRLQFNILNHTLIPKIAILEESEVEVLKKKYNLKDLSQLPEISRFDPLALAIMMRPNDVAIIIRDSVTALNNAYYRVCVH